MPGIGNKAPVEGLTLEAYRVTTAATAHHEVASTCILVILQRLQTNVISDLIYYD